MAWTIYYLCTEECDEPFYVGCTSKTLRVRLYGHKSAGRRSVKSSPIVRAGVNPESVIAVALETCADAESAFSCEVKWIATYGRFPNGPLFNRSGGGKANSDLPEDSRRAISLLHKGNTYRKGIPRPDSRINNSRSVSAFHKDGSFHKSYSSGRSASADLPGISQKSISSVLHGRLSCAKTTVGEVFQFRAGEDQSPMTPVVYRDTWRTRRQTLEV